MNQRNSRAAETDSVLDVCWSPRTQAEKAALVHEATSASHPPSVPLRDDTAQHLVPHYPSEQMWRKSKRFSWQEVVGGDILRAGARLRHGCQGNSGGWVGGRRQEHPGSGARSQGWTQLREGYWESWTVQQGWALSSAHFRNRCGTQLPPLRCREVKQEKCQSPVLPLHLSALSK